MSARDAEHNLDFTTTDSARAVNDRVNLINADQYNKPKESKIHKKINKVMIFAGEASGDLQGAALAEELREYQPGVMFSGTGGVRMKEAGFNPCHDSTIFGVIGAWEGLKKLPLYFELMKKCRSEFIKTSPDLAIFIDTPAFNVRLARLAGEMGVKSVYYFPPSAWSGSIKRAREISGIVDLVVNTFEYSAKTYERAGVKNTFYTGHPLVDSMQKWKNASRDELLKILGVGDGPTYISLLPGSRIQEIKHVLPLLVESAKELKKRIPGAHFLMPVASPLLKEMILNKAGSVDVPITFLDGKSHPAMAVSELVILASGSAALEAGILEKPMILTYRLNWFDYKIIKAFVRLKWAGLPNLILQREVIPELIQENATVGNICDYAEELIRDKEKRHKIIGDLKKLNESLGEPGVIKRIIRYIWENVV